MSDGAVPVRPEDHAAFVRGIADGEDPQPNRGSLFTGAVATTQGSSPWYRTICDRCGHSFRRGDKVRRDAEGTIRHVTFPAEGSEEPESAEPRCEPLDETARADAAAFSGGLLAGWPPGVPVRQLTESDWQVAGKQGRMRPAQCIYCGHTFRQGESVVICPCSPNDPGCGLAVHRDPAAGLTCWERWRPAGEVRVCPFRQVRVQAPG